MVTISDLKRYLDDAGVPYDVTGSEIFLRQKAHNNNEQFLISLQVNEGRMATTYVKAYHLGNHLNDRLKELINTFNNKYMVMKFFYYKSDYDGSYDLYVACSTLVNDYQSIRGFMDIVVAVVKVADDIYPEVQRAIWR